ncbi:hypothetical protein B296_00028353 [Ensete ventricosum]|uniref:Uncharacterized protein n=1 Tax=Ensete ventricosum TaxID=4639 RepID=A0A426YV05_ENSVE|nr:hypothetical protein B296_00028353 [Ensete ventricosum]
MRDRRKNPLAVLGNETPTCERSSLRRRMISAMRVRPGREAIDGMEEPFLEINQTTRRILGRGIEELVPLDGGRERDGCQA